MLLQTTSLGVSFRIPKMQDVPVTFDVNIDVASGEIVALVGESGSGKSATAMAIAGLNPPNAVSRGEIRFEGRDISRYTHEKRRRLLRKDIGVVFQDPLTSLNPVYKVGTSIAMSMKYGSANKRRRRSRAIELLDLVNIPEPQRVVDRYPHELSGGQRQRVMIAMAIEAEPKMLIADEPTTALDVTVQAEILDVIDDLKDRLGMGVLLITHDMGVVANSADRVYVMEGGRVREQGDVEAVFYEPQHEYTKRLFDSVPSLDAGGLTMGGVRAKRSSTVNSKPINVPDSSPPLITFEDVGFSYGKTSGRGSKKALEGITLSVGRGETVGLVGESGSGKSTVGRIAVGLLQASEGRVKTRAAQGPDLKYAMVFQDPASSLDPRRTIGESIAAPLLWGRLVGSRHAAMERARELLDSVQLPRDWGERLPHELSGGQRQRVGIARALSVSPDLLVADEPTSALDVSVQSSILDVFFELQQVFGFGALFISHDLAVIERVAHRTVVLNKGRIEEQGHTDDVIYSAQSAYTRALIASVPVADPIRQRRRKHDRKHLINSL